MKKIIFTIICLTLCVWLLACAGKDPNVGENITEEPSDVSDTVTEEYTGRVVTAIYGMFDEQYDFIYEDICLVPGTFTQGNPIYSMIDTHNAAYDRSSFDSLSGRTPAIFYLTKELSLTEVDLNEYYTACFETGITDIMPTSETMKAIVSGDSAKVMEACAHPSAMAKNGRIYSLRMLLEGDFADVTDDEIKATVERAKQYYGSALLKSDLLTDDMREKLSALGFDVVKANVGTLCTVHADEYHSIPAELEALVDASALKAWKERPAAAGGCGVSVNIADFVRDFNIEKDTFIEIYNSLGGTLGLYNINVIYDGDAAAYYSEKHPEYTSAVECDRAMAKLKEKIVADKGMADFVTNIHEFSLAEIIIMTDKDSAYIAELDAFMDSLVALPEISINGIYEDQAEYVRMLGKRSPYYIDMQVCGKNSFESAYEAHSVIK